LAFASISPSGGAVSRRIAISRPSVSPPVGEKGLRMSTRGTCLFGGAVVAAGLVGYEAPPAQAQSSAVVIDQFSTGFSLQTYYDGSYSYTGNQTGAGILGRRKMEMNSATGVVDNGNGSFTTQVRAGQSVYMQYGFTGFGGAPGVQDFSAVGGQFVLAGAGSLLASGAPNPLARLWVQAGGQAGYIDVLLASSLAGDLIFRTADLAFPFAPSIDLTQVSLLRLSFNYDTFGWGPGTGGFDWSYDFTMTEFRYEVASAVVPLPPAVWAAAVALGGVATRRHRRR